jgi:hypothetical protein
VRRAAIVTFLLGLIASGCSAPNFDLSPRFLSGEVRVYRLVADATVRISAGQASTSEKSHLVATTTVEVEDISAGVTTLTLTVTARSLVRDGKAAQVPAPQEIRMTVAADGRVTQVTTAGSTPTSLEAADVEDLVPLIGPPPPPEHGGLGRASRVHLGERWTRRTGSPTPISTPTAAPASPSPSPTATTASGTQESRLAALRVVSDYDCAVVAVSTRRPVVRERVIAGTPLRLEGLEFAASEITFAFREGLPITVASDSEARLAISGGAAQGGAVVIATTTTLTLQRRTAPGLR